MKKSQSQSSVLVTRPAHQLGRLEALLQDKGLQVCSLPLLAIEAHISPDFERCLLGTENWDWVIISSVNGAESLKQHAQKLGVDLKRRFATARWAAVGPQSAQALRPDIQQIETPALYHAEGLGHYLISQSVAGKRCLILRGQRATPELPQALLAAGAEVEVHEIYQSHPLLPENWPEIQMQIENKRLDYVCFCSGSSAQFFAQLVQTPQLQDSLKFCRLVSIGPKTSQVMRQTLGRVDLEAPISTIEALTEVICLDLSCPV